MDTKKLNVRLREDARSLGLCDKWYDDWDTSSDVGRLTEKYIRGMDFCIKHDYPDLGFIRENFDRGQIAAYGVFIDASGHRENIPDAVLIGDSDVTLTYDGPNNGNVYVRHGSSAYIDVKDGARVFVECYDNCSVKIRTDRYSKAFLYYHGGRIETDGNVTVRDKRKAEG